MLHKILQQVGLSPSEAKAYLTCLKLGTQDVPTIAKKTGISRYDVMAILYQLVNRGLMSKLTKGKEFFTAEPPRIFLQILENTRPRSPLKIEIFKKVLPVFDSYVDPARTRPEISFYEGKEGVISAYEDTLTSKTDILAIASIQDTEVKLPRYLSHYYQRRKTAGILIKAIFPDTPMARARQKRDKEELRMSRLIPADQYEFNIEMNIYDDQVAYFSVQEELAVIIKSADIASSMRNMFSLCWQMAEIYEAHQRSKRRD